MKTCLHCNVENSELAKFCKGCSRKFPFPCPNCSNICEADYKMCPHCGCQLETTADSGTVTPPGLPNTRELSANTKLRGGRFVINKYIAGGGQARVYKGTDNGRFGLAVAIKELLHTGSTEPSELSAKILQFRKEAQMLFRLTNPKPHLNIPEMIDSFTENGREYLVMDFIEGETLQAVLDFYDGKLAGDLNPRVAQIIMRSSNGFLDEKQVMEWAEQLCDVLDYLHSQEPPILFRDMKPSNIIITDNNIIKLIDFGIVRQFTANKRGDDTQPLGTPCYCPLEQYGGHGQTTPASDIYALGATLYHLLTRQLPPEAPERVYNDTLSCPQSIQVSPNFQHAIFKAMEVMPDQRPQSANEMKTLLEGSIFDTGFLVRNPEKFVQYCCDDWERAKQHFYDGDFEQWFRSEGKLEIADKAAAIRQAEGKVVISDDFRDNSNSWNIGQMKHGNYTIDNGRLSMSYLARKGGFQCTCGVTPPPDFHLSVNAKMIEINKYGTWGITFHEETYESFYGFIIDSEGNVTVGKWVNNMCTLIHPWTKWSHIKTGSKSNRLEVICKDSTISLFANGALMVELSDDTYTGGKVGFWVEHQGTHVNFSSLEVIQIVDRDRELNEFLKAVNPGWKPPFQFRSGDSARSPEEIAETCIRLLKQGANEIPQHLKSRDFDSWYDGTYHLYNSDFENWLEQNGYHDYAKSASAQRRDGRKKILGLNAFLNKIYPQHKNRLGETFVKHGATPIITQAKQDFVQWLQGLKVKNDTWKVEVDAVVNSETVDIRSKETLLNRWKIDLFVPILDKATKNKALKLAQQTDVCIIAGVASHKDMEEFQGKKKLEVHCLYDHTATFNSPYMISRNNSFAKYMDKVKKDPFRPYESS